MIDYILHNKEWIFSGIGVTILGLLFLIIRYFFKKKHISIKGPEGITTNITKPEPPYTAHENSMPQEDVYKITRELEEMPPLHLDDITKNYIGLNVDWLTEYSSAYKKDNDLIRVHLRLITKLFQPIFVRLIFVRPIFVWCEVKLSDYKQFSILKRNAKIRVIGKIIKFEPYSIELSDVNLFFVK